MVLRIVEIFDTIEEIEKLKFQLTQNKIECFILNENEINNWEFLPEKFGKYNLVVNNLDFGEALKILGSDNYDKGSKSL